MLSLGIDAAWSSRNPSGVALLGGTADCVRLLAVAASYADFLRIADVPGPASTQTDGVRSLLEAARRIGDGEVDIVAVDMPLSASPIEARRAADHAISRHFGARHCSTHSPTPSRPGSVSEALRAGFERMGYRLCTLEIRRPALIEVYPHPALVVLAEANRRLPYKVSRARSYWPDASADERRRRLLSEWAFILKLLGRDIENLSRALRLATPDLRGAGLKSWEDKLDAVICAWVGWCALKGRAEPYGDEESAIWVPLPNHGSAQSGASM
jgi:predicted RNase H-like nuclease